MKRIAAALIALAAVFLATGCEFAPEPQPAHKPIPMAAKAYPPQVLEHKGTAMGRDYPAWIDAALSGTRAVEKLPEFANQYVVIVQQDGGDLAGTQLAASRMDAQAVIAQMISTRVSDTFAGAQVGDKDKIETYMERCIKSAANARFTGFAMEADWWSKLQTYGPDGRPDRQVYRVIQVWGIDKGILQQQIQQILKDAAKSDDVQSADKQKAIDLAQQSFMSGF